jgi:hypothetical protein
MDKRTDRQESKGFSLFIVPKLHNDELHNLYSSVNIVMTIKLRRMR